MKKVIYNSKLAHAILWANYTTITLTAFVFTELKTKPKCLKVYAITNVRTPVSGYKCFLPYG